ncbi:hypothetical protein CN575_21760 [Bacillus wiedmannii]|uniref:hypothetical protein n=1 Tax=Bacillus wiedmannii TaxID=1890302 RepID=UPI000BF93F2E|nr:hypothetical protein [Bacillus wiedmannii]PEP31714.1 hypothetical protein CN575_21760 [Bacillus wiedmannii]
MTEAIGPIFTGGGFETFEVKENGEGYKILYLPDKNNHKLQQEGRSPVYYWLPGNVRLARNSNTGDYKFRHLHFVGNPNPFGGEPVVGGHITFTTTVSYPPSVLKSAQDQLLEKFRGSDNRYWGWATSSTPEFRIIPINNNVTNIQGNETGWKLDGEGPGNITGGENAYSGMLDALHSELLWTGFHGTSGPIVIAQVLQIPVWTDTLNLKITGNWERIFQHFSSHANGRDWFWSADIKREFNDLKINGEIQVEIKVDGTNPDADEMRKLMEQHEELIIKQFMELATKIIFEPAPPTIEPARTTKRGYWGFGGGFALKSIQNSTNLNLHYEETLEFKYNKEFPISSSLEGFYNIVKDNPVNEQKYFERVFLGDLSAIIPFIIKPVVNWPNPEKNFAGEPVAFLSAQVGYPGSDGVVDFRRTTLFEKESLNVWSSAKTDPIVRKKMFEVSSPPQDWTPDKVYIKRKIHFIEPPSESEFPFTRIFVERNDIDLDPINGVLTNEYIIELRVDHVGILDVGPISLGAEIVNERHIVEVEFRALGKTFDGQERPITKIKWDYKTKNSDGYWKIYTGHSDYKPLYQYRVRVIEKAVIGESNGLEWQGPWEDCSGNGPLILKIPNKPLTSNS